MRYTHSIWRRIIRFVQFFCLVVVVIGLCGWGVLAIYYGDSAASAWQTCFAALFGLAGIATVASAFVRGWRLRAIGGFAILFSIALVWWFSIAPSNNRIWQTDVSKVPYASIDGDQITVHNVRNFKYRTETDFTPAWYDKTYDLSKLESVDLYAVYWMGPAIAHTILSFGFDGKDYLAISIEARKEQGEGYSAIKGFFRQYELIYIAADERDIIRLRTDYRKDPPEDVYRFRLKGGPEIARQFFLEYVKAMNNLRVHPRFYNTLTANCTNLIWMHAQFNPDRVPFSWKILASGYGPEYLYDMGRLDTSVSFSELQKRGYVNPIARQLGGDPAFSQKIRRAGPQDG